MSVTQAPRWLVRAIAALLVFSWTGALALDSGLTVRNHVTAKLTDLDREGFAKWAASELHTDSTADTRSMLATAGTAPVCQPLPSVRSTLPNICKLVATYTNDPVKYTCTGFIVEGGFLVTAGRCALKVGSGFPLLAVAYCGGSKTAFEVQSITVYDKFYKHRVDSKQTAPHYLDAAVALFATSGSENIEPWAIADGSCSVAKSKPMAVSGFPAGPKAPCYTHSAERTSRGHYQCLPRAEGWYTGQFDVCSSGNGAPVYDPASKLVFGIGITRSGDRLTTAQCHSNKATRILNAPTGKLATGLGVDINFMLRHFY